MFWLNELSFLSPNLFIWFHHHKRADTMRLIFTREQDQDLDELSASVERLGGVGLTIHDELISQVFFLRKIGFLFVCSYYFIFRVLAFVLIASFVSRIKS